MKVELPHQLIVGRIGVRSIGVCAPGEQALVFLEIIPREVRYIERPTLKHTAIVSRPEYNAIGFESLDDAILNAQGVGFRLINYVKPQNLFFFFCETFQAMDDALLDFSLEHQIFYNPNNPYAPVYTEQDRRNQEGQAEPLAVVLCKVIEGNLPKNMERSKKKNAANNRHSDAISWGELEEFKKSIHTFGEHK